jgi:hypothetical protein
LGSLTMLVSISLSVNSIVSILSNYEGPDERERFIGWKADNFTSKISFVCAVVTIVCLTYSVPLVWVANGLLSAMFLQEFIKCGLQIHYYRNGM